MMQQFTNGQEIEYQNSISKMWNKGRYVGAIPGRTDKEICHVILPNGDGGVCTSKYDYEIRKPKVVKTGWINIYRTADAARRGGANIFPSKQDAISAGASAGWSTLIDTVQIHWEE